MSDAPEIITGEINRIKNFARRLDGLAMAFGRTGNQAVADELGNTADAISCAAQAIHDAYYAERSAETDQSIANGERFIGSILKSLLDGKEPKDACIEAMPHHFDRDIIEGRSVQASP